MYSCKKEDQVKPDPPNPDPTYTPMKMSGSFDFAPFNTVYKTNVGIVLTMYQGVPTSGISLYETNTQNETTQNFSFSLDKSLDSLKGKTWNVAFGIIYMQNGEMYEATLIKPIVFSQTISLGDVGFSNYDWLYSNPKIVRVILPEGQLYYHP